MTSAKLAVLLFFATLPFWLTSPKHHTYNVAPKQEAQAATSRETLERRMDSLSVKIDSLTAIHNTLDYGP